MSGRMMNRHILSLFVIAALAGCAAAPEPPLKGAKIGGPFTLTNQDGKTVKDTDFSGKYRLIYFGFTNCPDVCPVDVAKLMAGLKKFETDNPARGKKIQPIFVTVDPARDDPAALKPFVTRYHPRLIGLTGSEADIKKLTEAYAMTYQIMPPLDPKEPKIYNVAHQQIAYLMSPKGEPLAPISVDDISTPADEGPPAKVAGELDLWVH
jgi:protein SCO1